MTVSEIEPVDEDYYSWELAEIYEKYQTSPKDGLIIEDAEVRLEKYGFNEIPKVSRGFIKIYEKAITNNDDRMIKFCRNIFDIYYKFEINGHIKRPNGK